MAKKRYNYDDDWADIEDYYGDDIDNPDVNAPDIINTVKSLEDDIENLTDEDRAYLEKLNEEIGPDTIYYGENDPGEFMDHMVVEIEGEDGISMEYEVFGRIDIEERAYLVVHRLNDEDPSSLKALRAWEDEEGYIQTCEIEDEKEYKEVEEQILLLLSDYDDPNIWQDIPGGGVQWDDNGGQ